MPSEKLIALKAELESAIESIVPQIEGLEDFGRLNIQPATRDKITETHTDFTRRRDKIQVVLSALEDLEDDRYPNLDDRQVGTEVYADLKSQTETLAAALEKFSPEQASELGVSIGTPETK